MANSFEDVDFEVLKEDFSRYTLEDGTIIKAKVAVRKIIFNEQRSVEGYPLNINHEGLNVITTIVPHHLRKSPSSPNDQTINPQIDKGSEVPFETLETKTQEYVTKNGFKFTLKPFVVKIFKYEKYNQLGEPIYTVTMQAITNIHKINNN